MSDIEKLIERVQFFLWRINQCKRIQCESCLAAIEDLKFELHVASKTFEE